MHQTRFFSIRNKHLQHDRCSTINYVCASLLYIYDRGMSSISCLSSVHDNMNDSYNGHENERNFNIYEI